jgi:hypothetical protein
MTTPFVFFYLRRLEKMKRWTRPEAGHREAAAVNIQLRGRASFAAGSSRRNGNTRGMNSGRPSLLDVEQFQRPEMLARFGLAPRKRQDTGFRLGFPVPEHYCHVME